MCAVCLNTRYLAAWCTCLQVSAGEQIHHVHQNEGGHLEHRSLLELGILCALCELRRFNAACEDLASRVLRNEGVRAHQTVVLSQTPCEVQDGGRRGAFLLRA